MRNDTIIFALIISLLVITACVQTAVKPKEEEKTPEVVVEEVKTPEPQVQETEPVKVIAPEIKELLNKSVKKVQSLSYSYKGPETQDFLYEFFIKGSEIKYIPQPSHKVIDIDEDAYDAIYLDTISKTAQAYCDTRKCKVNGKKADLEYDEVYIWTPLDWLDRIESAEKLGEQLIEDRSTWKISTNQGTMWIDLFYGIPLQIEFSGDVYKFQRMNFNDVKDEDVIPS